MSAYTLVQLITRNAISGERIEKEKFPSVTRAPRVF